MASLPKFTEDIRKFLNNDENETFIEELKRATTTHQLITQSYELVQQLSTQRLIRRKLEEARSRADGGGKGLEGYWGYVLTRSTTFSSQCNTVSDLDALSYLRDVEVVIDPRDWRIFDIIFTFAENPYFSNSTLTKSFVLRPAPPPHTHADGESCKHDDEDDEDEEAANLIYTGKTASEQIGRPRPVGLSSSYDLLVGQVTGSQGKEESGVKKEGQEDEKKVAVAPQGEEWDFERDVKGNVRVEELIGYDEFDNLTGLKTEISWKSDSQNLLKILPRGGPSISRKKADVNFSNGDGEDDELEDDVVDVDMDEGDRGSWFHFFGDEDDHATIELGTMLAKDIVFCSADYFLGDGGDCEPEDDDLSLDEEDDDDEDEEIDLEDEESERPRKRTRVA